MFEIWKNVKYVFSNIFISPQLAEHNTQAVEIDKIGEKTSKSQ